MEHNYFKASDLVYKDYKETAKSDKDDPNYTVGSERALLNRQEKYEVLDFINRFAKERYWEVWPGDVTACQEVERLIHDELPGDIRSHTNVANWLDENLD